MESVIGGDWMVRLGPTRRAFNKAMELVNSGIPLDTVLRNHLDERGLSHQERQFLRQTLVQEFMTGRIQDKNPEDNSFGNLEE